MATKIFLKKDSNQSVATLPNWTGVADIFGAAGGNEVVNIHVGNSDLSSFSASAMTLDQNIEGVYLSQAIGNYQFAANGNEVSIKLGGVVVAKVTVQDDTDGTAITYAGQTTPIALTIGATSNGFAVQLGDQVLTSTPAAYGETPNPSIGSTEKAPWTLVMSNLISNGTAEGTNPISTGDSYYFSGFKTSADKNEAYDTKYDSSVNKYQLWTIKNETLSKISDISFNVSSSNTINSYSLDHLQMVTWTNNYTEAFAGSLIYVNNSDVNQVYGLDFRGSIIQVNTENNTIWHTIHTEPYGTELYKTTLLDSGFITDLVKDIYSGSNSGATYAGYQGNSQLEANGKLIFEGGNGITDSGYGEVWVSDGTDVGTFSLDLYQGSDNSNPSQFKAFNGKVVMNARTHDGTTGTGYELVITDGTNAGTKVLDVYAGSSSSNPTILGTINDKLYFTATDANGLGLFSTDGTTFSKLVAISDSNAQILGYTANKAYFAITDSANGKELWAADLIATTPSLTLVKDILAGSGSGLAGINTYDASSMPTMIGDKILFNAYTSGTNQALFVSDGTETGTVQLASSLPTDKAIIGNKVFFANSTGVSVADVSAATVSATQLKAGDFSTSTNTWPVLDRLQADSDQAFFLAADEKLYVSTGTDTIELANNVDKFKVVAEDAIYFIATNSSNVASLWYSDGTASGTRYIEDLTLSANSYDLANAVAIHTVGVSPI